MRAVGIKDLKAKLSEYVGEARRGERILVTERGEPVAELVPLSPERIALLRGAAHGDVGWSGAKPKGLRGVVVRGEPVADTVIRDRR
jgi:prevent-host-death family protein